MPAPYSVTDRYGYQPPTRYGSLRLSTADSLRIVTDPYWHSQRSRGVPPTESSGAVRWPVATGRETSPGVLTAQSLLPDSSPKFGLRRHCLASPPPKARHLTRYRYQGFRWSWCLW